MPLLDSGKATQLAKHLVTLIPIQPEKSPLVTTSDMYSNWLSLKQIHLLRHFSLCRLSNLPFIIINQLIGCNYVITIAMLRKAVILIYLQLHAHNIFSHRQLRNVKPQSFTSFMPYTVHVMIWRKFSCAIIIIEEIFYDLNIVLNSQYYNSFCIRKKLK